MPLFERYFPGGINSVRGYEVRRSAHASRSSTQTNGEIVDTTPVGGSRS